MRTWLTSTCVALSFAVCAAIYAGTCQKAWPPSKVPGGLDPPICSNDTWKDGTCDKPNNQDYFCKYDDTINEPITYWTMAISLPTFEVICITNGTSTWSTLEYGNDGRRCE